MDGSTRNRWASGDIFVPVLLAALWCGGGHAHAYEVNGTIRVQLSAVKNKVDIPQAEVSRVRRVEWQATYEIRQGRTNNWFSYYGNPGVVRASYRRTNDGLLRGGAPCGERAVHYEELLKEQSVAVSSGPELRLQPTAHNLTSTQVAPLKVEIKLPSLSTQERVEEHTVTEPNFTPNAPCAYKTIITQRTASLEGIIFELPDALNPVLTETITLRHTLPIGSTKHNLSYESEGWQLSGTVEVNLVLSNLPEAVVLVSPREPLRGGVVTFDASQSKGHYDTAYWVIDLDREACEKPEVLKTRAFSREAPPSGTIKGEAIGPMLNPITVLPLNGWQMRVREPNTADRLVRRTPILCPLTARLVIGESLMSIRSVSEPIRIDVKGREWNTVLTFDMERGGTGGINGFEAAEELTATEYISVTSSFREYMRDKQAINFVNVCVFDADATWSTGKYFSQYCDARYEKGDGAANVAKLSSRSVYAAIGDESGSVTVVVAGLAQLPEGLAPVVVVESEDGPFSAIYYFKELPKELFRTTGLFSPDFLGEKVAERNQSANASQWQQYLKYLELHEYMHTFFLNRSFEEARKPASSAFISVSRDPSAPKDVFDPARVIEQMWDTHPHTLTERAIRVFVQAFSLPVRDAKFEHERMCNWEAWVRPNDMYRGLSLGDQLKSLPGEFTVFSDPVGDGRRFETTGSVSRFAGRSYRPSPRYERVCVD